MLGQGSIFLTMGSVKHMGPNMLSHDQYFLEHRCPAEIRRYFPKSLFEGSVILEKKDFHGVEFKTLWIYYITSKKEGRGNVQRVIKKLIHEGYDVKIVLPGAPMTHICEKFGFVKREGHIRNYTGDTEYWELPKRCAVGYSKPCDSDCAWCNKNSGCTFKMYLEEYAYVI